MRRSVTLLVALAGVALAGLATACGVDTNVADSAVVAPQSSDQLVDLQLLGINDYHGHLQASTPGDLDGEPAGGAAYLADALATLRRGHKHSLTVAAGDLIGGSPAISSLFHDEPSIESLNAMSLDVSSVGNHEFDEGATELLRLQNGGCHPIDGCYFPAQPFAGAAFPWLAANVIDDSSSDTLLPPYSINDIDGVKVGFIGMTLQATAGIVIADATSGLTFLDEAETANALVPELAAQGVEAIVVLLHQGATQMDPPGDINSCDGISGPIVAINAALDPAIDVVITGHTHQPYNCRLEDPAGDPRIVTSAYSFGRVVTEVNIVLDRQTNDVRRDLSSATNHPVIQAELTPDPTVSAVIDKWTPLYASVAHAQVGSITADIKRGGADGHDRSIESAAGNLVADTMLWATAANDAEIAFVNPGGIRADLVFAADGDEGDGVVTFGEALAVLPFNDGLVTLAMTGAEIESALEDQCQPTGTSSPVRLLGLSIGFTYEVAFTVEDGDCTSIAISNAALNGVPLDPASTYKVTINRFLAGGGDEFATFARVTTPQRDGGSDVEALADYLGEFSPVAPPAVGRVTTAP